jgi:predicted phage baseplate assembly protein
MALRHRGRAVSAADIEWLAHEASSEVALARCLAETGPAGSGMPGWVTVVVAPRGDQAQPQPSGELMRRVREHLARRVAAAVAAQVRVVGPRYQPVALAAEIVVAERERAAEIEETLRGRLADFLHPLRGGLGGTGWSFGEPVRLSHAATLIETTPGVEYAEDLQLSVEGAIFGESVPIDADRLPANGRHLLKLRLEG